MSIGEGQVMKSGSDKVGVSSEAASADFIAGATELVSRTANLFSAEKGVYVLMIGTTQLLFNLFADLIFFSFYPLMRPLYTATIGIDPFSLLTSSLNLIGLPNTYVIWNLALTAAGIAVFAVLGGGAIKYALCNYRSSSKGSMRESLSFAADRAVTLITTQLVVAFLIFLTVSPIVFALLGGLIVLYPIRPYAYLGALVNIMPILLMCLFVTAYISVRFAPVQAVVVAEGLNALNSIKRAWELTSGNSWHAFKGIFLLMMILGPIAVAMSFLALMLYFGVSMWTTIIPAAINQLFLSPLVYVFGAVLYQDLGARKAAQAGDWWNRAVERTNGSEDSVVP